MSDGRTHRCDEDQPAELQMADLLRDVVHRLCYFVCTDDAKECTEGNIEDYQEPYYELHEDQ